jgi:hypothetical protein
MDQYRVSLAKLKYNDLKEKSEIKFSGDIIVFDNLDLFGQSVIFENKTFNCEKLIFENITNEDLYVHFYDCTFNCQLEFDTCEFEDLTFISCDIKSSNLVILNANINYLSFRENIEDIHNVRTNIIKNGIIEINGGIINSINIENICFENGKLKIINFNSIENCSINNSTLNHIIISHCEFTSHFEYFGNKTTSRLDSAFFNHCTFNYSSFFETTFNSDTKFSNCQFLNETKFENLDCEIFSKLKFTYCKFFKSTTFNRALIHQLTFEKNEFVNEISVQETYFDIIKIDRTIFEKGALFDDIQIKKIDNCDRRTIRTIKQELQKKENRIDYNRFRVYEFNAYRKDIKKQLIEFKNDKNGFRHRKRQPQQLKRDLFILNISDIVSEYGTDWKRALKFTLITGLISFTLFFILENIKFRPDLNNWKDFLYGYFRFFLITDFKNEYYKAGESVLKFNCFLSLVPFIIGKIAVAFGIYEMIQSFRKFKA